MSRKDHYLAGQIVEDRSFRPLEPTEYRISLLHHQGSSHRKAGGIFCFPGVPPGSYQLKVEARSFQRLCYPVTMGDQPLFLQPAGQNELWVQIRSSREVGGNTEISFPSTKIIPAIEKGAPVIGPDLNTRLAETLGPGEENGASLEGIITLKPGNILRLVRNWSFRLRLSPYHRLVPELLSLVGKVTLGDLPLAGAQVAITAIDGQALQWLEVGEARLATGPHQAAPNQHDSPIFGTEHDLSTTTDAGGNYHLYLAASLISRSVTVTIQRGSHKLQFEEPAGSGRRFRETAFPLPEQAQNGGSDTANQ